MTRDTRAAAVWLIALCALAGGGRAMAEGFSPQLCAFALSADQVAAGGSLSASLEFVNRGGMTGAEHMVFVHVRPASAGEADVPPATGADFRPLAPTYVWQRDAVVSEEGRPIAIPADFPPGRYSLFVGLYDPGTGERARLANAEGVTADQRLRVATFEVLPPGETGHGRSVELRLAATDGLPSVWQALQVPSDNGEIVLESGQGRVVLAARHPRLLRYELPNDATIVPGLREWPTRARLARLADGTSRCVRLEASDLAVVRRGDHEVVYEATVRDGEQLAARFVVSFRLEGDTLTVGVEDIEEGPQHLLMDVALPPLLGAQGPGSALVAPNEAGRLFEPARTDEGQVRVRLGWDTGEICAAAIQSDGVAVCRTRSWDNHLLLTMAGEPGARAGDVVPQFALRADATGEAAKVLLADRSRVEVGLIALDEPDLDAGWVAAAKWLRRDLGGAPNPIYADCLIYKIFCDSPGAQSYTTYADALEIIRTVRRLAPWLKQVVYLVGWQYSGHDTGYPATDVLNPRLGTADDLRLLVAEAAKLGAIVSFHDNFDDAYPASPQWDEAVIARDSAGALRAGGVWAGGQSYILAFAKYVERYGLERVRRTLRQLPVRESYHIDVLSADPMRRDHNPESPESTADSIDAKLAIIEEFNRHGIDVTSEGLTAPFVGRIGHSWHFWHRDTTFIGGERAIPFLAFAFHGGPTTYGNGAQSDRYAQDSALYGAGFSVDWGKGVSAESIAWAIYQVNVPWAALRDRRMEGYRRDGTVATVVYGPDTFVSVDSESGAWKVVVDGETLVEDDLVVVRRPGLLVLFSPTPRQAEVALPADLEGMGLRATNLATGEQVALTLAQPRGPLAVALPAMSPVLVEPAVGP